MSVLTPNDSSYYDSALKWLISKYGEKIGKFLTNRLCQMIRQTNDSCIDNFRVAEKSNLKEMDFYKRKLKNGCDGINDKEFIFKEKDCLGIEKERVFVIGYNYGH